MVAGAPDDGGEDDPETVGRPALCGGGGDPAELWPPPAFKVAAGEPGVTCAGDGDGVDVVVVVVLVVVVAGGVLTGGDGTDVVGTPGAETPGIVTPGTVTPGTVTPGTVTPGTVTPGTVTPGTVTPGTVTPGIVTPGALTPGTDTVGVLTVGMMPALLACGSATKMDSTAPASRAMIAADLPARPGKPVDQRPGELAAGRPLACVGYLAIAMTPMGSPAQSPITDRRPRRS